MKVTELATQLSDRMTSLGREELDKLNDPADRQLAIEILQDAALVAAMKMLGEDVGRAEIHLAAQRQNVKAGIAAAVASAVNRFAIDLAKIAGGLASGFVSGATGIDIKGIAGAIERVTEL